MGFCVKHSRLMSRVPVRLQVLHVCMSIKFADLLQALAIEGEEVLDRPIVVPMQ